MKYVIFLKLGTLLNIAICINSICNSRDVFQFLNRPIVNTFYIIF